jgi:hypothetical protein
MTAILTALLSAAAAFIGSWLAARFALDRFYHERIWERRAAAYTAIFDALHDQQNWYAAADAMMDGRKQSAEEKAKVSADADAAEAAMMRRIDSEIWLVSDQFLDRLAKLLQELKDPPGLEEKRKEDAQSHLKACDSAFFAAIGDLRKIAREELRVPPDRII